MAKIDDKVMDAVERELKKNPDASVDELQAMATKINKSMAELTKRQFHARYPLQVKRKMSPSKPRKKTRKTTRSTKKTAGSEGQRAKVRAVLLKLAAELAAAEERAAAVRVVAGIDSYVDEVLKVTG